MKLKAPDTASEILRLLDELRAVPVYGADGRLIRTRRIARLRGMNRQNIVRILRKGRERLAKARAAGVDLTRLPSDSKIRRATEARWDRLVNPPPPRGHQGREAAKRAGTSTETKLTKRQQASELRHEGLTEMQISKRIGRTERTVRRYLNGR